MPKEEDYDGITRTRAKHANRTRKKRKAEMAAEAGTSTTASASSSNPAPLASRNYTLTMLSIDTLQRVKDDIANEKINDEDIERAMPQDKKKTKKQTKKIPHILVKDAQKISDDVFADKHDKPFTDKRIGGHLIQCSHKAGHDVEYVKQHVSVKLKMIINSRTLLDDAKEREFQRINAKGKKRRTVLSNLQSHSSTSQVISDRLDDFLKRYDDSETEDEDHEKHSPFLNSDLAAIYSKT
ncbi:hypothetical protein E3P77_01530 [Wallemia ichthyophaga]|nr:hypothetical protein E3P77_01530 [Wallemia ichthyophaga]